MKHALEKLSPRSLPSPPASGGEPTHGPLAGILRKLTSVTMEERLISISFKGPGFDQVRLMAAMIVVLHHCRGVSCANIRLDPLFEYSGGFMDFGRFAVVIFFAISGFLVTPSLMRSGRITDYAIHRGMRIFPGLSVNILATMLVLGPLITTLSLQAYFADPGLYLYLKNVLTLTIRYLPGVQSADGSSLIVNGALWTLHFEVLCYAALALMGLVGMLRHRGMFLGLWLASYAMYVAICFEWPIASILPQRAATFVELFVYFGTGIFIYLYREKVSFSAPVAWTALACALAGLACGWGPMVMPLCVSYVAVFCGLSSLPGKSLLRHDLSYGVYLIHAPVLTAFVVWFPGFKVWPVVALIVMMFTLLLAYLSWVYVEKPALGQKRAVATWANQQVEALVSKARRRASPTNAEPAKVTVGLEPRPVRLMNSSDACRPQRDGNQI